MDKNKRIITVLMILTIVFTITGGTLAYWAWRTTDAQKTNITFTITSDFSCSADGGGNITSNSVKLVPTVVSNTTTANYIKREVKVNPTLNTVDKTIHMDLWLDIITLDSGLSNSVNFRYAFTTSSTSNTEGVVSSGNFYGKVANDKVILLRSKDYTSTTMETYYLWIWLDAAETDSATMNQNFNMKLGGECTDAVSRELYTANFEPGYCCSFRSPLVDPSEVNKIKIVRNDTLTKWFGYFKDQDVVMFNMYDVSAPQQGGADFDGDIFYLSNDPIIIDSKIDKHIILDIEDKVTAQSKPYTKENLIEYEVMTRDNRIGEITNVATSIENKYTINPDIQKLYSDYSSLLRIFQGKEIDFLKTGFRWHMNSGLRKHLKQLPYFLLHNYPKKMKSYMNIIKKNKDASDEDKEYLNAYHSPSPMNELCDYIETWEKKNIL